MRAEHAVKDINVVRALRKSLCYFRSALLSSRFSPKESHFCTKWTVRSFQLQWTVNTKMQSTIKVKYVKLAHNSWVGIGYDWNRIYQWVVHCWFKTKTKSMVSKFMRILFSRFQNTCPSLSYCFCLKQKNKHWEQPRFIPSKRKYILYHFLLGSFPSALLPTMHHEFQLWNPADSPSSLSFSQGSLSEDCLAQTLCLTGTECQRGGSSLKRHLHSNSSTLCP